MESSDVILQPPCDSIHIFTKTTKFSVLFDEWDSDDTCPAPIHPLENLNLPTDIYKSTRTCRSAYRITICVSNDWLSHISRSFIVSLDSFCVPKYWRRISIILDGQVRCLRKYMHEIEIPHEFGWFIQCNETSIMWLGVQNQN